MNKVILENPRPVNIYSLSDPETGKIRYVGKTLNSLEKRLRDHIYFSKRNDFYSSRWVRSLLRKNLRPVINLIEICDENNWEDRERHWIREMGKTCNLTNTLEGGADLSEEHKKKLCILRQNYFKSVRKPVCQYDWQGKFVKTWEGHTVAAKELGIDPSSLRRACSNPSSYVGGAYWRYLSETQEKDIKIVLSMDFKNVTKMTENYEILQHFRTMREAGANVGSPHTAIKYAIVHNTCLRGFRWAFTTHDQNS